MILERIESAKSYSKKIFKISTKIELKDSDKETLEKILLIEYFEVLKKISTSVKEIIILDSKEKEIYSTLEIKEYEYQFNEYKNALYFGFILNLNKTYDEKYNNQLTKNILGLMYSLEMIDFTINYLKIYNNRAMTEFAFENFKIYKIKEEYLDKKKKELEIFNKNAILY